LILKPRLCAASVFVEVMVRGWRLVTAFAVLCGLASGRWIVAEKWPEMGSTLVTEAWACGIAAFVAGTVAVAERRRLPRVWEVLRLLAVGGGLLAAPAMGAALRGPVSGTLDRTVALCFVPLIVMVVEGVWSERGLAVSLWPGLAGLGGALLVFQVAFPSSVLGWVGLVVPPIAVSTACVACGRVVRGVEAVWSAALLFAGGAVGLAVMEAARKASSGEVAQSFSLWAVGLDAVIVGLVVFVVLRVDALRYVARYFAVPLLSVVEGLVILHLGMSLRQGIGLALLAGGALALLTMRRTDGDTSTLHLD
jgi:hypothetical protein